MIQLGDALPFNSPFVMLLFVVIVECGFGHPLDLQKEVKSVFGP